MQHRTVSQILRFCWLLALILMVAEAAELARRGWLPEGWALRAGVGLVLVSKSLVLLAPACALAWVAAFLGRARLGLLVALAWGVALATYTSADLVVQARTGNPLSFYISYLSEAETARWGGDLGTGRKLLRGHAGRLLATLAASVALAALAWRTRGRSAPGAAWLFVAAGLACASSLAIQRALPEPILFQAVNRSMLIPWNVGFRLEGSLHEALEKELRAEYGRHLPALLSTVVPPEPATLPAPTISPNVVIVLCDSLRQASFDTDTMPRLHRFSRRGIRFDNAYAVGNTTPVGLYTLLHGYYPFSMSRTAEAERPIPWVKALRESGYDAIVFQSYRSWRAVEVVVHPRDFWVESIEEGSNWERDGAAVEKARELLARGGRPRLVVVHLVSTHYAYSYPPDYVGYQRAGAEEGGFFGAYHRSARYLDDLVGPWLEDLDLERNLVVFTSDHGESLGEDGGYFHGSGFSDVQRKVPLVIAGPGVPASAVVDSIVESVDVVPTLLSLLGLQELLGSVHGRARLPRGPAGHEYAALFRSPPLGRGEQRDLVLLGREGRFLLVVGVNEPSVQVHGRLGAGVEEPPRPLGLAESQRIVSWFRDLLRRAAGPLAPLERQAAGRG